MRGHKSGNGSLVSSPMGGKGGGNQSCQPIVPGGSGQVCFINDPFATYKDPYVGADIGQCTWYAAGMRPDLDGITTGNAAQWLKEAKGKKSEGTTPAVGAIAVNTTADGGVGHVAYVANITNGGATLILDEANVHNNGGVFLNISTPASDFQGYIYSPGNTGPTSTPLQISTGSLPAGAPGKPYSTGLTATGGTAPYTWSLASGSLPRGLDLAASGAVSGVRLQLTGLVLADRNR